MRILIVEDDWISAKLLKAILCRYGPCHLAFDGAQAIERFAAGLSANEPYELICMDIIMPNTNGLEALMQIRKIEEKHAIPMKERVKVIMITAADSPADVRQAIYRGHAASYLFKPIFKHDLIQELKNIGLVKSETGEIEKVNMQNHHPEDML